MGMSNKEVTVLAHFASAMDKLSAEMKTRAGKTFVADREALEQALEATRIASAEGKKREVAAKKAEANATLSRQALADQSEKSRAELGKRERSVAEREAMADEIEAAQGSRDKELAEREKLLRQAGVKGF